MGRFYLVGIAVHAVHIAFYMFSWHFLTLSLYGYSFSGSPMFNGACHSCGSRLLFSMVVDMAGSSNWAELSDRWTYIGLSKL